MSELTDADKALLDIFGKAWAFTGRKEQAIREATGLSATAATQRLNHLLDTEAGLAYAPTTVNRLRHVRARRQRSRSAKRIG